MVAVVRSKQAQRHAVFTEARNPTTLLCPASTKVSFATYKAAREFGEEQFRAGRTAVALKPYRCDQCPHWHVTSNVVDIPRTPEYAKAHSRLATALDDVERVLSRRRASGRDHQAFEALAEAERYTRMVVGAAPSANHLRSRAAALLSRAHGPNRAHAQRLLHRFVPVALGTETWTLVVQARQRLLDVLSEQGASAQSEVAAWQCYRTVLDTHIETEGLDRVRLYAAEFSLLCDEAEDALESMSDERASRVLDLLYEIDEPLPVA